MGVAYYDRYRPNEAIQFYLKSARIDSAPGLIEDYIASMQNIGVIYSGENNSNAADSIYNALIPLAKSAGYNSILTPLYSNRTKLYVLSNDFRMGYIRFPLEVEYKGGKYIVSNSLYSKDMWDSWAPGHQALYDAGLTKGKYFDPPIWLGTWYTEGANAIMGKTVKKEQPADSKSFIEARFVEIEAALKTFNEGDKASIVKALKPIMDPTKADELANSYADLIMDYKSKLCTLDVYRVSNSIPYAYELGDTEGPEVEMYMSIERPPAKTKPLQKEYKAAGMSKATLKSNYGGLRNKRYEQTFKLKLINDNWYITDPADTEECKVSF